MSARIPEITTLTFHISSSFVPPSFVLRYILSDYRLSLYSPVSHSALWSPYSCPCYFKCSPAIAVPFFCLTALKRLLSAPITSAFVGVSVEQERMSSALNHRGARISRERGKWDLQWSRSVDHKRLEWDNALMLLCCHDVVMLCENYNSKDPGVW